MEDILEILDFELITYLAKKTRIDSRKIIDDVRHKLSRGTVSNLENRNGNINLKTLTQYLTSLGLSKEDVLTKTKEIENEISDLQFQLELAQILLEEKNSEEAKSILYEIQIVDFHPLACLTKYILGKYFYEKDNFKAAKEVFLM
ncbi:hypothetical protein MK805_15545 [Shimazuella sp. AN120528]|uniref:hypothetical protein n=1 Tax=Shimazuella soli TaxID=1892854 RepID=UPI001F10FE5C|nr:hypothetical protein [Shimazuella soli]MCH5586355.1 hypothetical protein [Shimazuella soli]